MTGNVASKALVENTATASKATCSLKSLRLVILVDSFVVNKALVALVVVDNTMTAIEKGIRRQSIVGIHCFPQRRRIHYNPNCSIPHHYHRTGLDTHYPAAAAFQVVTWLSESES